MNRHQFNTRLIRGASILACAVSLLCGQSAAPSLSIELNQHKAPVSPTLYGLMTEEINYSYDGGLYADSSATAPFVPIGRVSSIGFFSKKAHPPPS